MEEYHRNNYSRRYRAKKITEAKNDYPQCKCDIPLDINDEDLQKLGCGCTSDRFYVCDCLNRIRRTLNV